MSTELRIARELLEQKLWPDRRCKVRIVGARFDAATSSVVLEIEGKDLPEGTVRLMSRLITQTEFKRL